jgi:type IV pilus assembly protein PilW
VRSLRGFSMIELMIAMTLALLVSGAVISVFVGSHNAYQATSGVASLTDSGSFALNLLQESVRGAGNVACNHATSSTNTNMLDATDSPLLYDFAHGVAGYEAANTEPTGGPPTGSFTVPATATVDPSTDDWTPTLDSALSPGVSGANAGAVSGSDVLVIRSSTPRVTAVYLTADAPQGATSIEVSNSAGLTVGQPAAISDCTGSVTFLVTGINGSAPATISIGGASGNGLPVPFASGAVVSPVTTVVYYIGVGMDGDFALKRLVPSGNGPTFTDQELVPDIENMQVLYGIDTTGTQTPSAYVTADQVPDFSSVVSIKLAVLAASPPAQARSKKMTQGPFTLLGTQIIAPQDTRVRRVFDTTITVRSAAD